MSSQANPSTPRTARNHDAEIITETTDHTLGNEGRIYDDAEIID